MPDNGKNGYSDSTLVPLGKARKAKEILSSIVKERSFSHIKDLQQVQADFSNALKLHNHLPDCFEAAIPQKLWNRINGLGLVE